jgi:hypothetical protein
MVHACRLPARVVRVVSEPAGVVPEAARPCRLNPSGAEHERATPARQTSIAPTKPGNGAELPMLKPFANRAPKAVPRKMRPYAVATVRPIRMHVLPRARARECTRPASAQAETHPALDGIAATAAAVRALPLTGGWCNAAGHGEPLECTLGWEVITRALSTVKRPLIGRSVWVPSLKPAPQRP